LEAAHRRITHVQNIDMTALNNDVININDNIDLRIQYLLKEIDDDSMKFTLQQREKKNEKERELRRVYETLTGAAADIFRRMVIVTEEKGKDIENIEPLITELNELRLFINAALDVLRRRYNCIIRGFGENWERSTLKKNRDEKNVVEIKTPFGSFNDILEEIISDFDKIVPITAEEDGYLKYKYLFNKIAKARKIARDFPTLTTNTQTLADAVLRYFDHKYNALIYNGGIRNSPRNVIYYTETADKCKYSIEAWRNHATSLELIVKPLNTIE
jgi:hypothetical protein